MSCLTVVLMASMAIGSFQNHLSGSSLPNAINDSFNLRWNLSTMPFASGWYGVVIMAFIPQVRVNCVKVADENWLPRSVVTVEGMP